MLFVRLLVRSFVRARSSETDSQKICGPSARKFFARTSFFLRVRRTRSVVAKRYENGRKWSENVRKRSATVRKRSGTIRKSLKTTPTGGGAEEKYQASPLQRGPKVSTVLPRAAPQRCAPWRAARRGVTRGCAEIWVAVWWPKFWPKFRPKFGSLCGGRNFERNSVHFG